VDPISTCFPVLIQSPLLAISSSKFKFSSKIFILDWAAVKLSVPRKTRRTSPLHLWAKPRPLRPLPRPQFSSRHSLYRVPRLLPVLHVSIVHEIVCWSPLYSLMFDAGTLRFDTKLVLKASGSMSKTLISKTPTSHLTFRSDQVDANLECSCSLHFDT
jgi:hypothetical protein